MVATRKIAMLRFLYQNFSLKCFQMDSEYEELASNCSSPRGASLPSSEDAEWKLDPSVPQVEFPQFSFCLSSCEQRRQKMEIRYFLIEKCSTIRFHSYILLRSVPPQDDKLKLSKDQLLLLYLLKSEAKSLQRSCDLNAQTD